MDKPRRVPKKKYVFSDDCSDDDDFAPSPRQILNSQSVKKAESSKQSPKKRRPTKRLSRDEQKFEKDLQLALQLSSTTDKVGRTKEDVTEAPSFLFVPSVKRAKKCSNYKEDDSDCWSEEEFKGWPTDLDKGSPSPKRKRKTAKSLEADRKQNTTVGKLPTVNLNQVDIESCPTIIHDPSDKQDDGVTVFSLEIDPGSIEMMNSSPEKDIPVIPLIPPSSSNETLPSILKQNDSCNSSTSDAGIQSVSLIKESSSRSTNAAYSEKTIPPSPRRSGIVRSQFRSPLVENSVSPIAVTTNPSASKIGLRLGLSRRGNIKPLHPNASPL